MVVADGEGVTVTPLTTGLRLSTEMDCDASSSPEFASVAVALQTIVSLGLALLFVSCMVEPVPSAVDVVEFVHSKPTLGVPPSMSVTVASQVSFVAAVTLIPGRIVTVFTTGSVLRTVWVALSVAVALSASVAVARHLMTSSGCAKVLVNARVLEPEAAEALLVKSVLVVTLLQVYDRMGVVASSASEAVAVHVNVAPVFGFVGVREMLSTVGGVLDTVTVAMLSAESENPSVAVAVQLIVSNGEAVVGVKLRDAEEPRLVLVVSFFHA